MLDPLAFYIGRHYVQPRPSPEWVQQLKVLEAAVSTQSLLRVHRDWGMDIRSNAGDVSGAVARIDGFMTCSETPGLRRQLQGQLRESRDFTPNCNPAVRPQGTRIRH